MKLISNLDAKKRKDAEASHGEKEMR